METNKAPQQDSILHRLRRSFTHVRRDRQTDSSLRQTYQSLFHWHDFQLKLFWEGIVVGIFAGLVNSLFRWGLGEAELFRMMVYDYLTGKPVGYVAAWAACLCLLAYVLYRLTKWEPMAGGSGIPQVKGVILGLMRFNWFRILYVKLSAGILGLGAGLSLGREGPSIQLGAVTAQGVSRFLGRSRMEERYLITSGASAGLATAFNAPLAGVIFSLEEIHRNFSAVVLLPAMTAALTATFISRLIFGRSYIFSFYGLPPMPLDHRMAYALLTAVLAGLAGVCFNKGLLNIHRFYDLKIFGGSLYRKILFAILCAGVLGFTLPYILGGGNMLVNRLAVTILPLDLLLILFVGKFVFTLVSYGTGVPGGFFLPMLVLGALTGSICAHFYVAAGWILPPHTANVIVIAMAAFFSASVRSPITGTVLICEMTGSFSHLMTLAMAAAVSYVVAEFLGSEPIYEALLLRQLKNRKEEPEEETLDSRTIIEVPVGSGSQLENRRISEIAWPPRVLLVDVKRGDRQIIPDGSLVLRPGDYLYILADEKSVPALMALGEELQPHRDFRRKR
jgi:H+/Cl- antiporter ClcA